MDDRRLRAMLVRHEGRRYTAYRCPAGKLTIGIGHNLESTPLSDAAIDKILDDDITLCITDLERIFIKFPWFSEARKAALIDMRFNLGYRGFRLFRRMIDAILAGDWDKAAVEALDSTWAGQVGRRAEEIARMLASGEWADG